jgi:hypothetical protein
VDLHYFFHKKSLVIGAAAGRAGNAARTTITGLVPMVAAEQEVKFISRLFLERGETSLTLIIILYYVN